ncbi:hypothetical protein psyc5s11_45070 [Clostridium gelidum]|uniref:CHAT domain-containing protein n=1 Tax=Clostridium gelidum TaxID=704125 RepID=A0ABM7TBI0_9CLOT|nr:hypothetical protein [Clostridium gelidum]BCZ48440.1 hypothetical protein psyc5s11_45070 [Clostridium gelidum]
MDMEVFYKVYIIESPNGMDLLEKRTEGKAMTQMLEMSEVPYEYFLATTEEVFKVAFELIKEDVIELQDSYAFVWPIIHISCHGNSKGIALTDNNFIPWTSLEYYLSIINICFEDDPVSPIVLSMSSCYGLNAIRTDWEKKKERSPFAFVLGHEDEIPWDDALIAFSVFFHNFVNKKTNSQVALKCMNDSINSQDYFKLFCSKECREVLIE